jgi:hypothetical protein
MSDAEAALKRKALMAGMPYGALLAVYRRGIGAWKTNPESVRLEASGRKNYSASRAGKMGKERWAHARVNAFIDKRPTVYTGADDDIRRRYGLK